MPENITNLDKLISDGIGVCVDANINYLHDSDAGEISDELDKRARYIIDHPHRQGRKKGVIRRTLLVAAVIILLTTGTLMSVSAFREKVTNIMTDWGRMFFSITIDRDESTNGKSNEVMEIKIPALLEETCLSKKTVANNGVSYAVEYLMNDGCSVCYEQCVYLQNGYSYECRTENCITTDILINGNDGIAITYQNFVNYVFWHDDEYTYTVNGDYDVNTLIEFAESVK